MSPAADVVVIVVVHNQAGLLPACLTAVSTAARALDARIVVVDSGSTDAPQAVCAEHGVPFLPGPNRGLAVAFNRALARDEVRHARYVLQLNPDVILPERALDTLVARADAQPRCGILAPRQVDQDGDLVCSIGVEPSPVTHWGALTGLPGDWIWDREHYLTERSADWIMGACLLLRGEMLAAIGGFDERFFLCSEEVDLCRRAREAGWGVLYTPAVTVTHPRPPLLGDEHRVRLEEWSRIVYMRKWSRRRERCSMRVALALRLTMLAGLEAVTAVSPRHAAVRLRATLRFDPRRYGPAPASPCPPTDPVLWLTMTDRRYLPQLLTLHRSMAARSTTARSAAVHLVVLCLDAESRVILDSLHLDGVEALDLAELEHGDRALAAGRSGHSWSEYLGMVTPAACAHLLETLPENGVLAWVDADIEFVRDPHQFVVALGSGSLLLTPHHYQRAFPTAALASELTSLYGRFNGGTIAFRHDEEGLAAARLWRERTLAWCYHHTDEPGRFGNQHHLDDFPARFPGAVVLPVPGGVLGPWHSGRFPIRQRPDGPTANGRPVIAYHFQSLHFGPARPRVWRWLSANVFDLGLADPAMEAWAEPHYRLSRRERRIFWEPHAIRLGQAVVDVSRAVADVSRAVADVSRPVTNVRPADLGSRVAGALDHTELREAIRRGLTLRLTGLGFPVAQALRVQLTMRLAELVDGPRRRRARRRRSPHWAHR